MKTFLQNILPFNNREDMPVLLYVIKKILAFLLCLFGAGVIVEMVVGLSLTAMGKDPLHGDMFSDNINMLIMFYGYIFVSGLILLYWKLIEKKSLAEIGLTKNFGSYFIGMLITVPLLLIPVFLIIALGGLKYNGVFASIDYPMIALFFGGFIFQGLYEEILCRGLLLHTLKRKTSIPVAIGISSIAFTVLHISSIENGIYDILCIANLLLISVIFSMLTLYFKSLWAACGLHTLWNFVLFNILGLNLSGNDEKVTAIFNITADKDNVINGGMYGVEGSAVTMIVLLIGAVALIVIERLHCARRERNQ